MRKIYGVLALAALFATQPIFADDMDVMPEGKACTAIAKACKDAGFAVKDEHKKFWKDCMRPVVLGKTVSGVKVDSDTVKKCQVQKEEQLKKELKDLQDVMGKSS